jgi:hypothetical protein
VRSGIDLCENVGANLGERGNRATPENANSAKFIILHRNGDHEAPRPPNTYSRAAPALVVAVDRPALATFAACACYR